ncbi:MAG: SiaB family protein kinase [Bacteroidia bacterium]|nr:SiaB family protein kinase [Bacteroidia bacterium]
MDFIYDVHQTMRNKELNLVYEGQITQEITKSVLAMAERNMDTSGEETSVKKKVFNVMVECLQNICKHSDEVNDEHSASAIFIIGREKGSYIISTGNPVLKGKITDIETKLSDINKMDVGDLKTLYKSTLKNNKLSEKGGAGLGFIDIARRTGNKFTYDFSEINDQYSFFTLQVKINKD